MGAPPCRGAGPDELLIAAYHRKSNGGRRALPFGLRLRFESDSAVTVADADLAEAPDLLARTSVSKRVTLALAAGALTVAELAEQIGAPEATVSRALRRLRQDRRVVLVDDTRPGRWELTSG
jgi:DNA-binding transcriptional ArsR family regulator